MWFLLGRVLLAVFTIFLTSTRNLYLASKMQRELVDQNRTLDQTAAGAELSSNAQSEKRRYDKRVKELEAQLRQAVSSKNKEVLADPEVQKAEARAESEMHQERLARLHADSDQLLEEMKQRHEKDMMELTIQLKQKEQDILQLKQDHAHDLEVQQLLQQLKLKELRLKMIRETACTVMCQTF